MFDCKFAFVKPKIFRILLICAFLSTLIVFNSCKPKQTSELFGGVEVNHPTHLIESITLDNFIPIHVKEDNFVGSKEELFVGNGALFNLKQGGKVVFTVYHNFVEDPRLSKIVDIKTGKEIEGFDNSVAMGSESEDWMIIFSSLKLARQFVSLTKGKVPTQINDIIGEFANKKLTTISSETPDGKTIVKQPVYLTSLIGSEIPTHVHKVADSNAKSSGAIKGKTGEYLKIVTTETVETPNSLMGILIIKASLKGFSGRGALSSEFSAKGLPPILLNSGVYSANLHDKRITQAQWDQYFKFYRSGSSMLTYSPNEQISEALVELYEKNTEFKVVIDSHITDGKTPGEKIVKAIEKENFLYMVRLVTPFLDWNPKNVVTFYDKEKR